MNVSKQLQKILPLGESKTYSLKYPNGTGEFLLRAADLETFTHLSIHYNVPLWHVIAVAAQRLHNDVSEHQEESQMGI